MKFLKHENFPNAIADLLRQFEFRWRGETSIHTPQEEYGDDVSPGEWLLVVGNQGISHRPTILTMDGGPIENAVSTKALSKTGCSFVILTRNWSKEKLHPFAWKIIRVWPEIVEAAQAARDSKRQCKIEVALRGDGAPRIWVTNF